MMARKKVIIDRVLIGLVLKSSSKNSDSLDMETFYPSPDVSVSIYVSYHLLNGIYK